MYKIISSVLSLLLIVINLSAQDINKVNSLGQKSGKWAKTYDNGKLKYEGQFNNGIPTGTFTYYFKTGEKRAQNIYSDNGKIADNITYYKNGFKMAEGQYINQKKEGLWKYFIDEEGNKMVSTENYLHGELNGECITYYPDSCNPAEIVYYKEGVKNGKLIKYFPDGKLMTTSYYKNGQPDGEFIHYHPNGQIQIKGIYKNGEQFGEWKYYDEDGNEIDESKFKPSEPEQ